jgi:hypothetical protein
MDNIWLVVRGRFGHADGTMKSIILSYPGFQALPRGLKQLLVASESDFFSAARPALAQGASRKLAQPGVSQRRKVGLADPRAGDFDGPWRN